MQSVEAVINLARIRENARSIIQFTGKPLIAVVKDDAYGHGAARVAHTLSGIAMAFAVATAEEGAALRIAGIEEEILVMTPPISMEDAERMRAYRLTATLSSLRTLSFIRAAGCRAQLAVNTGMNRYGVRPDRIGGILSRILQAEIPITGAFSHLYLPEDEGARAAQTHAFSLAAEKIKQAFPEAVLHLDATGGSLAGAEFDAVRVGLALYGYLPRAFRGAIEVKPAMKIYAYVAETRRAFGAGAGYMRAKQQYRDMYTLRMGYGDGFFQMHGMGIGALCMDACVAAGKEKAGRRKCILRDVQPYADACKTSVYEILVKLGKGTEKHYIS